jgi:mannose-6-phosphate isomerase-like protein (cupin superfamily)
MSSPVRPVSIAAAPHYTWGDACDGWHLVRARHLSVIQERMPARTSEERHWHTRARQFFYLLDGAATIEIEGQIHTLSRGTGVEVAPGVAHRIMNESSTPAEFLVISQPPAHGDRVSAPDDTAG